jgi:hypothetical protein
MYQIVWATALIVLLSGCATIDFGEGGGLTYYDPKPYLFVSTTADCVSTATIVVIPEKKRSMKFIPGYGSSELTATLSNGMVTTVGQTTDSKIPETISALASLAPTFGMKRDTGADRCVPAATLYPVVDGVPNHNAPIKFVVDPANR